jgi:fused signal recognition particle receptor
MQELRKIHRVVKKQMAEAPQETLLVLDASTGQNALSQARYFKDAVEVNGVFLAKLDGTAKGGIVFAIASELGIPIRYVGTGEDLDDVAEFDPQRFVAALFEDSSKRD